MKKMLFILLVVGIVVSATACGKTQTEAEPATQSTTIAATATAPVTTEATQEETSQTEQPQTEETQTEEQPQTEEEPPQEKQNMTLQMTIGSTPVSVSWEDNEAVQALKELCDGQPLAIQMSMYGGFEQVGSIGTNLPANDVQTTTSAGDIVLYSGNQMVVFYGSNSWAYTRLGHITDKTNEELTQLLSNGNVTVTLSY